MNCENCQTELEEGVNTCPQCGAENTEPAVEETPTAEPVVEAPVAEEAPVKTGLGAGKIALLVALAVAAIAVVVALVAGSAGKEPQVPEETVSSDAAWVAAEQKANDVLNEWLAGEKTEDSFAAMAGKYSQDPGSSTKGGLYEDVYVGQMVEPFEEWCFDDSRQVGDYGIVKTSYGYHIMYFVGSDLVWMLTAEQDLMVDKGQEFLQSVLEKYPAEINYSAIALGDVELAAADTTEDAAEDSEETIPADGNPEDVTCKGSYTVTDEEMIAAADVVVATMGDMELTNSELQIYYWMQVYDFLNQYYSYASVFGLDITQPLDCQQSFEEGLTWQQYFLKIALEDWRNNRSLRADAEANGYVLDQEYAEHLEALPEDLEKSAVSEGYESATDMVREDMGPGATMEAYLGYLKTYYLGYMYYGDTMETVVLTDAEIEAYFDAHAEEYKAKGLEKTDEVYVDVRHILITPESAATG